MRQPARCVCPGCRYVLGVERAFGGARALGRPALTGGRAVRNEARAINVMTPLLAGRDGAFEPHLGRPERLVQHDARVRQALALPLVSRRQQQGGHGGGLADAQRGDRAADVLGGGERQELVGEHLASLGG